MFKWVVFGQCHLATADRTTHRLGPFEIKKNNIEFSLIEIGYFWFVCLICLWAHCHMGAGRIEFEQKTQQRTRRTLCVSIVKTIDARLLTHRKPNIAPLLPAQQWNCCTQVVTWLSQASNTSEIYDIIY